MARPPLEITEEFCEKAEQYAAQGLSVEQIALCLGIGESTLYNKQTKYKEFKDAIKRGRASGIQQVTNSLFNKALKGDNIAAIFFLKNRDPNNWEEIQKRQISGPDGKNLPPAKTIIEVVHVDKKPD